MGLIRSLLGCFKKNVNKENILHKTVIEYFKNNAIGSKTHYLAFP